MEDNTGPARYDPRGLLDQSIFHSRRHSHPAYLRQHTRRLGSQDPALCRLAPLLRRVRRLRRCQDHARLYRGPHSASGAGGR